MARILILFVVIALSACSYDQQAGAQPEASAGVLSGRADVVDGDTLDVAGKRIRLFGNRCTGGEPNLQAWRWIRLVLRAMVPKRACSSARRTARRVPTARR